jgi:hypothetical protein
MGSMPCNVKFGYQLSICSGTKENHRKPWSSWPVSGPSGCKLTSNQKYGINSASPNSGPCLCCCFSFVFFFLYFLTSCFFKHRYVHMILISIKPYITHVEGIDAYMNKYIYIHIISVILWLSVNLGAYCSLERRLVGQFVLVSDPFAACDQILHFFEWQSPKSKSTSHYDR